MNAFENELSTTFKRHKYHWKKLSVASTPQIRFMHKPPYDYYVLTNGNFYAVEAKSNAKKVTSFPFNRIDAHQREGLQDAIDNGGQSYIFINFRKPKNTAYAIKYQDFIDIENASTAKSIPMKIIESDERFIPLLRNKKIDGDLVWDTGVVIV